MGVIIPKKFFLTSGVGRSEDRLFSFELALRNAGVEGANFLFVSSICPTGCIKVNKEKGIEELGIKTYPGRIVFAVRAQMDVFGSNETPFVSASVAYARPADRNHHGYFVEYHGERDGEYMKSKAIKYAKKMVESKNMTVGDFDAITAHAVTTPDEWVCVLAMAVLID